MTTYSKGFSGKYSLDPDHWQGGMFGKQIYEFNNDPVDPLTYCAGVRIIRPDQHFLTDMGSVPKTLQYIAPKWFAKDRFPKAYIFHDSGYKHGGHWLAVKGGWRFFKMTRQMVDELLLDMIIAEGGGEIAANLIYAGVRSGGWLAWRHRKAPVAG